MPRVADIQTTADISEGFHRGRDTRDLLLIPGLDEAPSVSRQVREMLRPIGFKTLASLSQAISAYIDTNGSPTYENIDIDRTDLAKASLAFHRKAGTLTNKVSENISSLLAGSHLVVFPHQPNFFPSLKIMVSFIFFQLHNIFILIQQ